ncbi:MAG: cysteine hydrolase family protein [Planctomycetota bacterium]|jgi:nicotinamidase/pyrazinamidase
MAAFDRVFVDVDTQFDFLDPAGALYVPGSIEIHGVLGRLFRYAGQAGIPVLSSVDEHPPGDPEFDEFGLHCVKGTPGQDKMPFTKLPRRMTIRPEDTLSGPVADLLKEYEQLIFAKATLNVFDNPHFVRLIEELEVVEYVFFGVATDYCVLKDASGLLERGRRVKIIGDAVRQIGNETGQQAIRKLSGLGAEWIEAADILGTAG